MPRPLVTLILLLCLLPAVGIAGALSQLVSYTSSLDGSTQQYGVYIPAGRPASPAGYPAIFHMHGYGWWVGTGFSDWQKQWADDHGWILIQLNARGPQFYEGVGDVETRNVVRDANERFGLDLSRLFLTGGSMGGTGAFRIGVRYPDLFAGAVGVDGWTDFREWHYHWYARTDQRNDIEEFRRPLLEAASPLYWAGRARWNAIQASVSGRDDVVVPDPNGVQLANALLGRSAEAPGTYANRLFLDYNAGHGGSTRIDQIYDYFLNREVHASPPSFLCETPLLTHGEMYWGSMLRLKLQGAQASLESDVDLNCPAATVTVLTHNLAAAAVHLQASPAAPAKDAALYVDGFRAYEGPPKTVNLRADFSPRGDLWGWAEAAPADGLVKTPDLEGPVGEAFKRPFVVAYGTDGTPEQVVRNRREAEDFVRGWNGFMVHADALVALPEERVTASDLANGSLILFGTEQSSRLLREANARRELPVHVREDAIIVTDPQWGDRVYLGRQYGAFLCYPNPLSDFRQLLVVCRGQWATKPDGTARQGLEYDLEKLPWAYSDYVIFDTEQAELPHVLNVNNKPPVTCYEAGYFVEAGWFDQDWQPYRAATLDRVRAKGLPTKLIHVERLQPSPNGLQVLIADAGGAPVPQARVTVRSFGLRAESHSAVTNGDGLAAFPDCRGDVPCSIVNVMATGAEYDWQADRVQSAEQDGVELAARATAPDENGRAVVTLDLGSDHAEIVTVRLRVPVGQVDQPAREVALAAGEKATVSLEWRLPNVPVGTYCGSAQVATRNRPTVFTRPVFVTVGAWPTSPLRMTELVLADLSSGSPWQVTARITNLGTQAETAAVRVSLPGDGQYFAPQALSIKPGEEASLVLKQPPDLPLLGPGVHGVRVYVEGQRGVTAYGEFTVR